MAWMDGRSDDVRRPAAGAGQGRGDEARGYKQAWQTDRRADMQADGPNRAKRDFGSCYFSCGQMELMTMMISRADIIQGHASW